MLVSEEIQLGYALDAFGYAHGKPTGWPANMLESLTNAGINTMADLATGCKEGTVNLDLELFGTPKEERLAATTIQSLRSFLPGPVGCRCFRLAQKIAHKVRKGTADTEYVHRPESGKMGEEEFHIPTGDDWTVKVDCAGFVRNVLKHVTKNPFVMLLSDRDFMRAKDFYGFFSTVPYTVLDKEEIPETDKHMKWRIVPDLRMAIPGDVITYRPKGNAAGGAAFTTNDRKGIVRLLKAVKASQFWHLEDRSWDNQITRNAAKDPRIKPWVDAVRKKLNAIGIASIIDLLANIKTVNEQLKAKDFIPLAADTLRLMEECLHTTAMNTGHIVFASGKAVPVGNGEYRIRVVHSTKYGVKNAEGEITTGVQEYFRRFKMVQHPDGKVTWTRQMKKAEALTVEPSSCGVESEDEENLNDDTEEDNADNEDIEEPPVEEPGDELSGQGDVDVIVARMCF